MILRRNALDADARHLGDIEAQLAKEDAPTEERWFKESTWQPPELEPAPRSGKRLGNKRLKRWQGVKVGPLADALEDIGEVEATKAMRTCGCLIIRDRYERGTVFRAFNECNFLFCPTANIRRAAKQVNSKGPALERFLTKRPGTRPVFVTLTQEATPSYDLWVAVNQILIAFGKLMRRAAIKRAFLAWLRSLEVTRNPHTGFWMVHLHCIFIVGPDYFEGGSKAYLTYAKLRQLWKACLRANYDPQVDIRALKGNFAPLDVKGRKSLQEVLKYCFKPGSLIYTKANGKPAIIGSRTRELFDPKDGKGLRWMTNVPLRALILALKDRRLVETSGNLKGNLELDFTDDPDGEAKAVEAELGEFVCREFYAWREYRGHGDFFLVGRSFERPKQGGGSAMGP
jgi:plasmid rolling circle replication initiator protein Rep